MKIIRPMTPLRRRMLEDMHYVDNNLTLTKTSNSISYNTTYQLAVDLETGTSSTALLCATIPVFTLHNMLILCLLILNQNFIQGTDPIFARLRQPHR
jgi:hypothetical protein